MDAVTLHPDIERIALLGWRCVPATRTKKGLWSGYLNDATHDLDQLEKWARDYPGCCWKVVPAGSGVWGLDVDVAGEDHAEDGIAALRALCDLHGPLPPRPHGRSGSGGHLLIFKADDRPMMAGTRKPAPGLDTCAGRVAFTVSPSCNRRGDAYRWSVAPWEVEPPAPPEWLRSMLIPPPVPQRPALRRPDQACAVLARVVARLASEARGGRNAALNRAAFTAGGLAGAGLVEEAQAVAALYSAARHIGLSDMEARATIKSGFGSGLKSPISRTVN